MSKIKYTIPAIVYISELYNNLYEYYLPKKKRISTFNLTQDIIDEISLNIETYSNNKIKIEKVSQALSHYYDNIFYNNGTYNIIGIPLDENLYPENLYKNWKSLVSDGIADYLYNNKLENILQYMDKNERKDFKESNNVQQSPLKNQNDVAIVKEQDDIYLFPTKFSLRNKIREVLKRVKSWYL